MELLQKIYPRIAVQKLYYLAMYFYIYHELAIFLEHTAIIRNSTLLFLFLSSFIMSICFGVGGGKYREPPTLSLSHTLSWPCSWALIHTILFFLCMTKDVKKNLLTNLILEYPCQVNSLWLSKWVSWYLGHTGLLHLLNLPQLLNSPCSKIYL